MFCIQNLSIINIKQNAFIAELLDVEVQLQLKPQYINFIVVCFLAELDHLVG